MGWNGSGEQKVKVEGQGQERKDKFRVGRGALAGLIVVVGAGLAAWLFLGSYNERPKADRDRSRAIKEVQPAKAAKQQAAKPVTPPTEKLPMPKLSGERIEKREEIPAPQPLEEMTEALTNKVAKKKIPFRNGMEQLIALATPSSPGAPVPPLPPITEESVAREVEKGLKNVIKAEEDDSPELLERKLVVAEAKEEFRDLRDKEGWGFAEYVNALRDKANLDSEFMAEAHKMCDELYHDKSISDEDYVKYRDQLNEKLRERGLPEIEKEESEETSQPESQEGVKK